LFARSAVSFQSRGSLASRHPTGQRTAEGATKTRLLASFARIAERLSGNVGHFLSIY
jgi:hypothetical protein